MKDYNFILFHKCIDNIIEAKSKLAKAEMELVGSTYKAEYNDDEMALRHDIKIDIDVARYALDKIHANLVKLEKPI